MHYPYLNYPLVDVLLSPYNETYFWSHLHDSGTCKLFKSELFLGMHIEKMLHF